MADCITQGVNYTDKINNVIDEISQDVNVFGLDNDKLMLSSYLTNDTFRKSLTQFVRGNERLKKLFDKNEVNYNDYRKITINDIDKIIQDNEIKKFIKDYYTDKYKTVNNSTTDRIEFNNMGFSNGEFKSVGQKVVAQTLRIVHNQNAAKSKTKRRTKDEIMSEVVRRISDTFFTDIVERKLENKGKKLQRVQDVVDEYQKVNAQVNTYKDAIAANIQEIERLNDLIDELPPTIEESTPEQNKLFNEYNNKIKELERVNNDLKNKFVQTYNTKFLLGYAIVNATADTGSTVDKRARNFANLVHQLRRDYYGFIRKSLGIGGYQDLLKEYSDVLDETDYKEFDDNNIIVTEDEFKIDDSRDTTTKNWNDAIPRDFQSLVKKDNELYLRAIPKLRTPIIPDKKGNKIMDYDTSNVLGTFEFMDYEVVKNNILANADISSPQAFLESIKHKAESVPELAGLSKIYYDCLEDPVLLNRLMKQFEFHNYEKTQVNIENGNSIKRSNNRSNSLHSLLWDLNNEIRYTKYHAYDSYSVTRLQPLMSIYDSRTNKIRKSAEKLFETSKNDSTRTVFDEQVDLIKSMMLNVFNGFDTKIIDNYINEPKTNDGKVKRLQAIAMSVNNLYAQIKEFNDAHNRETEKLRQSKKTKVSTADVMDMTVDDIQKLFNEEDEIQQEVYKIDEELLKDINQRITDRVLKIAQLIQDYSLTKNEYTSIGVEGNRSSDILKNSWISRLHDAMQYEDGKNTKSGVISVIRSLQKGDSESNQFAYHPVLYGSELYDTNGKVIAGSKVPGMINRTTNALHKNVKDFLVPRLFEGVNTGSRYRNVTYNSMSGNDYLITKFMQFVYPMYSIEGGLHSDLDNGIPFANYFLRVPSDATHNYTIQYGRLSDIQIESSLTAHLKQEFCNFISNLTNVFDFNDSTQRYELTKDANKINRLFYNAHLIKEKDNDGKDIVVLQKDGQLVGNFFNFIKFFNANGKDYNKLIKSALSLYGEGTKEGLINVDRDGILYIDPTSGLFNKYIKVTDSNNSGEGKRRFKLRDDIALTQLLHNIVKEWKVDYLAEQKVLLKDKLDRIRETEGYYSSEKTTTEDGKEINEVGEYTEKDIDSFLLNDMNMFMNYDEFFDGNGGYYKSAQDYLKRAKQVQAGGESFAIGNKFGNEFTQLTNITALDGSTAVRLETKDGVKLNIGATNKPLMVRNGFRAITIQNTNMKSKRADALETEMYNIFKKELETYNNIRNNPLSEEEIDKKASVRAARAISAFREYTKINDAQSYITLDEFIRRSWIDGTFNEYAPLFEKLKELEKIATEVTNLKKALDNGDDVEEDYENAVSELEELRNNLDISALDARIQVQKNFYFDHMYDDYTDNYYSRQIKNAEFVLIKGLLGTGSDLDKLYDIMIEKGIDQVNTSETSKASNRDAMTYWDNEGNVNRNFVEDLEASPRYIENYYYKYLYKQQENPQHMENARNKFGLQAQVKIPDNIDPRNEYVVGELKNYFKAYRTKIENSHQEMLNDMGYKYKDGKVVNISDESEILDPYAFYKLALEEATRLGVTSQFMEYLDPDPITRHPKMPNFMNLVSTKIENVIQALYNSRITRQKLPGWHAVQVASLGTDRELNYHPEGWYNEKTHKYITQDEYNKLEDKSGWEKTNIPIVEIRIPRWDKSIPRDIPEEELIKKLHEAGLDQQIINRIPTEGKQSIAVAKVVGFIDDIYGSTVLLPHEWVVQTGADFDTDSVYSMYHHMRYDKKKGKFIREKFFNPDDYEDPAEREAALRRQYTNFVFDKIKEKNARFKITKEDRDEAWQEAFDEISGKERKKELNEQFASLEYLKSGRYEDEETGEIHEEGIYYSLPEEVKEVIKNADKNIDRQSYNNKREKYYNRLSKQVKELTNIIDKYTGDDAQNIQDYIDYCNDILDILSEQGERYDIEDVKDKYSEILSETEEEYLDANFITAEDYANRLGIVDFKTFKTLPVEGMNTNKALDNRVIDSLMNILQDPSSREENYATSNFVDISEAMDIIGNIEMGMSKQLVTMYDTNSQIRNFTNAMSGTKLKGMSVNLDTFLSKTAMARAKIGGEFSRKIRVKYDITRKDKNGNNIYDVNSIIDSFGEKNVEVHKDYIIVTHNNLGWSNDNKNVVDKIISMYSSETTPHTLDAMKVGSAYNVNEFTFKAYKLMPMLGVDYYTAMAFIYQPGISKLNVEHDKLNSAYINASGNEIRNAVKNIIKEIYRNDEKCQKLYGYFDLIAYASTNEKTAKVFKELLRVDIDKKNTYHNVDKVFDISLLIERLNHVRDYNNEFDYKFGVNDGRVEEDKIRDACIDLIVLSQYDLLSNLGNHINNIAQLSKPEKAGAAQTIYETKQVIRRINNITGRTKLLSESEGYADSRTKLEQDNDEVTKGCLIVESKDDEGNTIVTDFLSALYPVGLDNKTIEPERSFYPFIAQVYKDATVASADINSHLFRLEDEKYYRIISDVEQKLGRRLSAENAKEFKKYLIGYVYTRVPSIALPIKLDADGKAYSEYGMDDLGIREDELHRIYGFATTNGGLHIKNVNNPTQDELNEFARLTPAQKVLLIQRSFKDGRGVFDFISAEAARPMDLRTGKGSGQHLYFNEDAIDIESMYEEFAKSFSNKNPLIRLAAIDLVKYALIVENHNFGKGKISKVVINDALNNGVNSYGLDVVYEASRILDHEIGKDIIDDEFVRRFIRSHSEIAPTVRIFTTRKDAEGRNVPTDEQRGLQTCMKDNGIIVIPKTPEGDNIELNSVERDIMAIRDKFEDYSDRYVNVSYVNKGHKGNVLYEVNEMDDGTFILIPHSKLDRTEQHKYSFVKSNLAREYFRKENPETGEVESKSNYFKLEEYYKDVLTEYKNSIGSIEDDIILSNRRKDEIFGDISKAINKNKETAKENVLPQKQIRSEYDAKNDRNLLDKLSKTDDKLRPALKPQVDKFISIINDPEYGVHGTKNDKGFMYVYNVSKDIRDMFPQSQQVIQRVRDRNGKSFLVVITKVKKGGIAKLDSDRADEKMPQSVIARNMWKNESNTYSYRNHIYRVKLATQKDIDAIEGKLAEERETSASRYMASIPRRIEGINYDESQTTVFDDFMPRVLNKISLEARNGDKYATEFMDFIKQHHINLRLLGSVAKDANKVYRNLDYYYNRLTNYYKDELDSFELSNGERYSVDDPKLYEALAVSDILDQSSDYNKLIKLLLDVRTLKDYITGIGHLSGNDEINKHVDNIIANVDSLSSHKISTAYANLFNIYFAKFSTDPLVKEGIVKLREQFGDLGRIDFWLTDVKHIRSKEVQVVIKLIDDTIARVERIIAPRAVEEFETQFDKIVDDLGGNVDFSKIIDKNGYFVKDYTPDFIERKRQVDDELDEYVENGNGMDNEGYYRKYIEKERFYINNVNRELNVDYYKESLNSLEEALNEGGDIFIEFKRLQRELYDNVYDHNTEEEATRRASVQRQINELLTEFDEVAEISKSDETIKKIRAVQNYRKREMNIGKKYYQYNPYEGWKDDLKYYLGVVTKYDETHTLETHDQKMNNPEYKTAYNWIQSNAYRSISDETKNRISALRQTLYGESDYKGSLARKLAKTTPGVIGENNKMDPRKFSNDQIRQIKEDFVKKHSRYSTIDGINTSLLKSVPSQPILTDAFWNEFNKLYKSNLSVSERKKTIARINQIITPFFNRTTGKLNTLDLIKYLQSNISTYTELTNLYSELHKKKGGQTRLFREKFKKSMEMVYNTEAFNEEQAYMLEAYNNGIITDVGRKMWYDLFTTLDEAGTLLPNFDVFGYFKVKDNTYVNEAKTKAKEELDRNVTYVPTDYYYDARREAIANGRFNEWYDLNHVYNTTTGKWEPLRIWTKMELREDNEYGDKYEYTPTRGNSRKLVKDEYKNKNYVKGIINYNSETGSYNNGVVLTEGERRMKNFLQDTVMKNAYTDKLKYIAETGMVPRLLASGAWDTKKVIKEVANSVGLVIDKSWKTPNESKGTLRYSDDKEIDNPMMQLIRTKGWEEEIDIEPQKPTQSDVEYRRYIRDVRKRNDEIRQRNLERERAVRSGDIRKTFSEFVKLSTINKHKNDVKNTLFTLIEELDLNKGYYKTPKGGIGRNYKASSFDYTAYHKEDLLKMKSVVENWGLRRFFDDYHEHSKARSFANSLQQFTSAKFMIGNMWSGITNITMGWTNMAMETFAGEYFELKDCKDASWEYAGGALSYIQGLIGPERTRFTNKADALIHYFNVLEYDRLIERQDNEKLDEYSARLRKLLYLNQSGGEHLMQNSVLLATLKGTRIWYDQGRGMAQLVSKQQLRYEYEHKALSKVLERFPAYKTAFDAFKNSIKENKYELFQYDKRAKDLATEFIKMIYTDKVPGQSIEKTTRDAILEAFKEERKKSVEEADKKFETLNSVYDQVQFVDGKIKIVDQKDSEGKIITHDGDIGYLTEQLVGDITNRVISINKKIHGVYDKDGAAMLERQWFGSLLMQYHKHIWPGIMKHWRRRGYWNETRGTRERGMYTDLFSYFNHSIHLVDEWKASAKVPENGFVDNFIASLKSLATVGTELKLNWQLMPSEQRNNMARILGELSGLMGVYLTGMLVYSMYDDEEEVHESPFASNVIYLADRLASEIIMFNGYGSWQEVQTLWSNPVAGGAFFADAMKAATLVMEYMIDPDFNSVYDKGPYKGMSKWEVLARRNFWLTRLGLRFTTIGKNNKYYRIGNKSILLNAAKASVGFGEDDDDNYNTGTRFEQ